MRALGMDLAASPLGATRCAEWPCGVWEEGRRAAAGSSRRIHEYLDLNMNRERSFYHEYEYENAAAIMSMNSKRKAIFNSTHVNRLVFMRSSARLLSGKDCRVGGDSE